MILRYTSPEFSELWSPIRTFRTWLRVELAACEAMESEGTVPRGTAQEIEACGAFDRIDPARIEEIERTTRHDVIAFLTHMEELVGERARWLHLGMTSSDVVDTSTALLLREAAGLLVERQSRLVGALARRAREHASTPCIGRSHGMHAEPTTFGLVLAGHLSEAHRGLSRLSSARDEVSFGKLSGAVGTYAHLHPRVEAAAMEKLGLRAEPVSTQVVPRDRHAHLLSSLALAGAGIERLATNVRHLQRTEVGEAEERFSAGQKGSSAMPHKRNPILSENLCGVARLLRGYTIPGLESVALWHERDISHSSAERAVLPDATSLLGYMQDKASSLVDGLVVRKDRMASNLESAGGLWASEAVLLLLTRSGSPRQESYVWVQRCAMAALDGKGEFRAILGRDPDVSSRVSSRELDEAFDLEHCLRHACSVVEASASGI